MDCRLEDVLTILPRTPAAVRDLLLDLPGRWTNAVETPGTWSPFDVVGHLIVAERRNWMPRVEHLLREGEAAPFPPFDREEMFTMSRGRSLGELLNEFDRLRTESVAKLTSLGLTETDLERLGQHPEFGRVTLRQLLATWVAHDLSHIGQVVRVMARQYSDAVGPWRAYLSVLREPQRA